MQSEPLPLEELREVARKNRSVNVDLADYYSLRWHDPYFIGAWERFNKASSDWNRTWPNVKFRFFRGSCYEPIIEGMPQSQADIAQEFIDARTAYLATIDHYLASQV